MKRSRSIIKPEPHQIIEVLTDSLEELKALDIQVINVSNITTIADTMIIASGRSDRQVKALAEKLVESAKAIGLKPLGVEGLQQGEWVLVDLGDVITHIMHPTARAYYQLEKLWLPESEQNTSSGQ